MTATRALPSDPDIVVIGAGAAGLAAARTAREAGATVAVIEAKDRIGGRAYTAADGLRTAFDHGCYWLHSADENPFVAIADALEFHYDRLDRQRLIHLGGRWADAAEQADWDRYFDAAFDAIVAVGRCGRDVAVREVLPDHALWRHPFERFVAAYAGVDADEASTLDFALYRDTDEDWPVREGYGTLIARHGAGLPIALGTPASRIVHGRTGVRVETPRGTIAARAAIVTASTAVLAAEVIRLDPPLPDRVRAALAAVPMGHANKIAVEFDRDVFADLDGGAFGLSARGKGLLGFQIKPVGTGLAVGYVGGRAALALEREGARAMGAHAVDELVALFGSALRARVTGTAATAWSSDPWIRGGYSAARPGRAAARADLRAPVGERLFLAGEALSPEYFSTAHGAHLSGIEAAAAAIRAIGAGPN
ncbi:MAG: FAD-dependent oxidoreductase [Alphaproteobacteria bacterium]|nr:FAD-dependent oxidoreductase [Alphaproteobacteria bacterium]